jgi:DNA-binding response OmpR family regulator
MFLLIDDEDMVTLAFREYLVRNGIAVDTARDLPGARCLLGKNDYSVIWLDLRLTGVPTAECLEFLAEARHAARQATIVASSGYASEDVERQARVAGADQFISKPFDPKAVAGTLATLASAV